MGLLPARHGRRRSRHGTHLHDAAAGQGTSPAGRRHLVGRRATDGRHRPRAAVAAPASCSSTNRRWASPAGRRKIFEVIHAVAAERHHPPRRAGRQPRAGILAARLRDGIGRITLSAPAPTCSPTRRCGPPISARRDGRLAAMPSPAGQTPVARRSILEGLGRGCQHVGFGGQGRPRAAYSSMSSARGTSASSAAAPGGSAICRRSVPSSS